MTEGFDPDFTPPTGTSSAPITTSAPSKPAATKPSYTGISGRPITDILSGKTAEIEHNAERQETAEADPAAQEKIGRMREKFLAKLAAERPRIGVVYETMEVAGNIIRVRVASQTLHDEVVRHRTETLGLLAAVAGVHGSLELEVTIDETMKAAKPIRIEDKIKHLAELNPEFNNLRRTLDMEIE